MLSAAPLDSERAARLAAELVPGGQLLAVRPLGGGSSAQVTALDLRQPDGAPLTLVVRQHGAADRAANPQIAAAEFGLLQYLHVQGLPVPPPYALVKRLDLTAVPAVVTRFLAGAPALGPLSVERAAALVAPLAAVLAQIHQVDGEATALARLPRQAERIAALIRSPASADAAENQERAALAAIWPPTALAAPSLLHGDFWPGNVLWLGDQISGVLDWEDAAVGDPLADVANARLELLWAAGPAAMRDFTAHYQALTGCDLAALPAWDLAAVLRHAGGIAGWAPDAAAASALRAGLATFRAAAWAALAAQGPRLR